MENITSKQNFTFDDAFKTSVEYFDGDELAAKTFLDANALKDVNGNFLENSPIMMHRRMAREFARIEKGKFKSALSEKEIFDLFDKFKYLIPQSSPMTGIGNNLQILSLSNCVHGESMVFTQNRGLIAMKDIQIGDFVLTHKNRFKRVLKHWSNGIKETYTVYRSFSNKIVNIRNEKEMSRFLSITPEHKVLTDEEGWISIDEYKNKQHKKLKSPKFEYGGDIPELFPVGKGRHIFVDVDFMWILGIYLAEGAIKTKDNSKGTYFTLNLNEDEYIDKINKFSEKIFGHSAWTQKWEGYNFVQINIFELEFSNLIFNLCNCGFNKKRLPEWIFGLNDNLKKALLDGFLCGDGTNYETIDDNYNFFAIANPTLAYELGLLARSIGKNVRFNFLNNGKLIKNQTVSTTIHNNEEFIRVIKSPVKVEVFDMQVEDDNSFVAGDIICHNCFVIESPQDSYGAIMRADEHLVQLSKRRGGVGVNLSNLRPSGTPTTNAARTSTGIVSFAERYSNSIREVGQNGRRGALMEMLNIHHPESVIIPNDEDPSWSNPAKVILKGNPEKGERDIETLSCYYNPNKLDFISMKLNRKLITGANVSVILTNEFLNAVKNKTNYQQRFPVDSATPVIKKDVNALKAWKKIIHMAWQSAEPGLIFWDRMKNYNAIDCYKDAGFETICTNPCGEIPLCAYDSCRLMVVNLLSFVNNPFTKNSKFDFELFKKYVAIGQRLMDDLIDLEIEQIDKIINKIKKDPETSDIKSVELNLWIKIREKAVQGRRTGLGITAFADMLAALNIKFDSKNAINFTDEVMMAFKHSAFNSSCEMAKELGAFPVWNWNIEKNSEFLLQIKTENEDLYKKISKYGRRNIGCLTLAPTGTPSIFAQTSSSGEPVYSLTYTRRKKINPGDINSKVDFVDGKGDSWQHFTVYHTPLKKWMEINKTNDISKSPWNKCCASDIDWKQRVLLQSIIQKHIDHSISSTVNLPSSVSEDDVAIIYETAWKNGCKGITVYRDGCRSGVLIKGTSPSNNITKTKAIKRPTELTGKIYALNYKNDKIYVENDPYEIFTGVNFRHKIDSSDGKIIKQKRHHYLFKSNDGAEYHLTNGHSDDSANALTRMISCALRHGSDITFICDQLEKTEGDLMSFSKVIARVLKKHIKNSSISSESCPECATKLVYQNGCKSCLQCGFSACK
jgi:ribonucleoside-diphosphate reductase alpha chain